MKFLSTTVCAALVLVSQGKAFAETGQCNVFINMVEALPMWRDNGVPVSTSLKNVLSEYPREMEDYLREHYADLVFEVYRTDLTSADMKIEVDGLCNHLRLVRENKGK